MDETNKQGHASIYEIGYLIASSIPEEKIPEENQTLRKIVADTTAIIAEEAPHRESLAYPIRKKTVSGSYDSYSEAYFGWIKFEVDSDKVEAIKKSFEKHPSVIRVLLISTIRENTYLGKRASAIAASISTRGEVPATAKVEEKKTESIQAPASIEEMDKSIDKMVKEV